MPRQLLAKGFDTFVLRYSIREARAGRQPGDRRCPLGEIRAHAAELGVDQRVASWLVGTRHRQSDRHQLQSEDLLAAERDEYDRLVAAGIQLRAAEFSSRPDAIVPCYAVFSMDWPDDSSREWLTFGDCLPMSPTRCSDFLDHEPGRGRPA